MTVSDFIISAASNQLSSPLASIAFTIFLFLSPSLTLQLIKSNLNLIGHISYSDATQTAPQISFENASKGTKEAEITQIIESKEG